MTRGSCMVGFSGVSARRSLFRLLAANLAARFPSLRSLDNEEQAQGRIQVSAWAWASRRRSVSSRRRSAKPSGARSGDRLRSRTTRNPTEPISINATTPMTISTQITRSSSQVMSACVTGIWALHTPRRVLALRHRTRPSGDIAAHRPVSEPPPCAARHHSCCREPTIRPDPGSCRSSERSSWVMGAVGIAQRNAVPLTQLSSDREWAA